MNAGYLQDLSLPLLIIVLMGAWIFVSLIVASIGGWRALSREYRADFPFHGKKLGMETARLRWGISYGNCVNFGINREGLYLSVFFPIRAGHPPLFIPWTNISTEPGRQFLSQVVRFNLVKKPGIPVIVSKGLAEKIYTIREQYREGRMI